MSVCGREDARTSRLLVCLDLQRGSIADGQGPDGCLVNCRRMLEHAREEGWRIIHVHSKKADPADAKPIDGLHPLLTEPVVYRDGLSPFSNRIFRNLLASLGSVELVVIGYSKTSSFVATALIAFDQELSVTLVEDSVCPAMLDQETRDAITLLGRKTAGRFLTLACADDLIGRPRLRRVV